MTDPAAAATWDRHAPRYALQERLEERAIQTALRLAAPAPGERLVDLGTGTGLLLRRLVAHPARPREAIGVDPAAGMLARVGELPRGWRTIHADARAVPLPGGCADVVTCAYVLQLLGAAGRAAVLAEARRLLAPGPGSRLVLVTPWAQGPRPAGPPVRATLRLMAGARPGAWGGLRPLDPAADLVAAGFTPVRRIVLPRQGYPSLVLAARVGGTPDLIA